MWICLMFLVLVIPLAQSGRAQSSACTINQCMCIKSPDGAYDEVKCFVISVTPSDLTVKTLPHDVESLTLTCISLSERQSFLLAGMFQKFQVLKSLSIEQCNISVLAPEAFQGLVSLRNLSLIDSTMPLLGERSFVYLLNLQYLTLVHCNLNAWPDISHFKLLHHLNISHNNIDYVILENTTSVRSSHVSSDIDSNTADCTYNTSRPQCLNYLVTLDLSYNKISSLPVSLLKMTPDLQYLYLRGLLLTQINIPDDLVLKSLSVLDARENFLEFVDFSSLCRASAMKELLLHGSGRLNNITGLSCLSNLEKLSLNNFAIPDSVWDELNSSSITRLDFTNNALSTIDVAGLSKLKMLSLARNMISQVNNLTFVNQPDLILVNISHNKLRSLPPNLFRNNPSLKALDLAQNNITDVHVESLAGLHELLYLDLGTNLLTRLPEQIFRDLTSMLELYLQDNQLKELPKLSSMPALMHLNISNNQILAIIPHDILGLDNLLTLYASNNQLTILPPKLLSWCWRLLIACFDNNHITEVGTFADHQSLALLRLDNNQILDFISESPFRHMKNLQYLSLDGNNLTTVTGNMFPSTLVTVFLDKNDIKSISPTSFRNLPHLKLVSLTKNKHILPLPLTSVNVFAGLSPKPTFLVGNNMFFCDCLLAYLKVISQGGERTIPVFANNYPKFVGIEHTDCFLPHEGGSVRPFQDVHLSQFMCDHEEASCDFDCPCCYETDSCECVLTCPDQCKCYYGGSAFTKTYVSVECRDNNLTQVPVAIPLQTVILYLDGNRFSHLLQEDIGHLRNLETIYLNASGIETIENGTFEKTKVLVTLILNDNVITTISENLFGKIDTLQQIYLHNNFINSISSLAFSALSSIQTITLHNNRLMFLDAVLPIPPSLTSLTLSGNPWSCQCNISKKILQAVLEMSKIITDMDKMCCYVHASVSMAQLDAVDGRTQGTELMALAQWKGGNNENLPLESPSLTSSNLTGDCQPLVHFSYATHCQVKHPVSVTLKSADFDPGFVALTVTAIILFLLASAVLFVLVKWHEVQAWVFVKLGVRILDKKEQIDREDLGSKMFDAFISYSSRDDEFVARTLVPALENGERRYRVCVHYRDFPVGQDIAETICQAIESSSRTILLLTQNFLDSEWCRFEFQTAHRYILCEGSQRLIIVIMENLDERNLDPDLKVHLKSRTYLKYTDPWFWEKLFFALPSVEKRLDDDRLDVLQGMRFLARDNTVIHEPNTQNQYLREQRIRLEVIGHNEVN